jgi:hypothetical protein
MLTDNLRLELQLTVASVNRWSEKQCDMLDFHKLNFDKTVEEFDTTVAALSKSNDELEQTRPLQAQLKAAQTNDLRVLGEEISGLRNNTLAAKQQLKALTEQEAQLKQQLASKSKEFAAVQAATLKAQNDRRFGLSKFVTALGLRFEKAQQDSIKFIFANLLPANAAFEAFFIIRVDDDDAYQLMDVAPVEIMGEAGAAEVAGLVRQLNEDNDIGQFAARMRGFFQRALPPVAAASAGGAASARV